MTCPKSGVVESVGATPGTFSIAAHDTEAAAFGVAIATGIVAVGATCPYVSEHGAVLTQSFTRTEHGLDVLGRVAGGAPIDEACRAVLRDDPHEAYRQVHGVDGTGATATVTGKSCVDWCGHEAGDHVTVAGNMLVGPAVLAEMRQAFEASDAPFEERLLDALAAGRAAGGDERGHVSAALLVHAPRPRLYHNLRVDAADEPITALRDLYVRARSVERELPDTTEELLGDYPDSLLEFGVKY